MIKAILSDFDGTLVGKGYKYNPEIKELISRITAQKIHFSLASGQPHFSITSKIMSELNLNDYHIFHGGALIIHNQTHNILFKQYIPEISLKKVINYFEKNKLLMVVETIQYSHFSNLSMNNQYIDKSHERSLSGFSNFGEALKIILAPFDNKLSESEIDFHINNLSDICKDLAFTKIFWNYHGIDITSEKATKHTAVLEYERLLNIPRNEIVAIGDGHNDYPLFTACGYKIAMDNAPKELKDVADFIAPSVENNGTVIALQHIIKKFRI